jgi:hypothetical protein
VHAQSLSEAAELLGEPSAKRCPDNALLPGRRAHGRAVRGLVCPGSRVGAGDSRRAGELPMTKIRTVQYQLAEGQQIVWFDTGLLCPVARSRCAG